MNAMTDTEVVQYVLQNKSNYYKVLMVGADATEAQIKVAYKKMALKCHPDKNKHKQAADAFKLVGTAHTTLSDATKRSIYDRHGAEGVQRHESGGARRSANGAGVYRHRPAGQRDFFEEFFFGNGYHANGHGVHPGAGGARYQAEVNINPNALLFVPIVVFLLVAMLLSSSYTDVDASNPLFGGGLRGAGMAGASFSFTASQNEGFVVQRTTSLYGLRVPYYTTPRMSEMMDRRKEVYLSMEQKVLETWRDSLGRRCEAESLKYRSRGRNEVPPVCGDYQHFPLHGALQAVSRVEVRYLHSSASLHGSGPFPISTKDRPESEELVVPRRRPADQTRPDRKDVAVSVEATEEVLPAYDGRFALLGMVHSTSLKTKSQLIAEDGVESVLVVQQQRRQSTATQEKRILHILPSVLLNVVVWVSLEVPANTRGLLYLT
ncbi:DnaJ domain family protein [Leishmania donovani]|uniref:DnaJ domain family protein n=1 Tax=Leishmania donovani TaxID=5661 RepID=A0A504X2Q7_LEIDO|nr:DnaJ domain family protein [Leishmania donovani]